MISFYFSPIAFSNKAAKASAKNSEFSQTAISSVSLPSLER